MIKELGGNRECRRKWDYLRQHLAVASLTEKMGRSYISIYRFGEDGRGLFFLHGENSPPGHGLMSTHSLSDQVPVEVIGNLLTGTRRWDRWPRNHVVCCQGERQAIKETV